MGVDGNTYTVHNPVTHDELEVHLDRLKGYRSDYIDSDEDIAVLDKQLWLVDNVVAHRGSPRKRSAMTFKVQWQDFGPEYDTWEPYANVKTLAAFATYCKTKKLKF